MKMSNMGRIAIIGAGKIGMALAKGLLGSSISDHIAASGGIILTRRSGFFTGDEDDRFDCSFDNRAAVQKADIIVLAVEPKKADEVLQEICEVLMGDQLLISVVSGLTIERIEKLTGAGPVVRAMPNIAAEVGQSVTALASNSQAEGWKDAVEEMFDAIGKALWIPEEKFPEATVFFGSWIALALQFLWVEMEAAVEHGFDPEDAMVIASQILRGASELVQKNRDNPRKELSRVLTRGGCTIEMMLALEEGGFVSTVLKANNAGIEKAKTLYS